MDSDCVPFLCKEASNEEHFEKILLPVMLLRRRRLRRSARLNIRGSIFREGGVY